MNKQNIPLIVTASALMLIASAISIRSLNVANTSLDKNDTITTKSDIVEKLECNQDIYNLNTQEISRIIRKYRLNNTGMPEAQINLERIKLNYRDGQLVSADSSLPGTITYKYTDDNYGVGKVKLSTVYGYELTGDDRYDTLVKIEFNGRRYDNKLLDDVLYSIFKDKDISEKIKDNGTGILKVGDALVNIEDNTYGIKSGVGNLKILVFSNSGVQSGKFLDASRLEEVEQLLNPETFKKEKNYDEKMMGKTLNLLSSNNDNSCISKNGITGIDITRAYVSEFDRTENKELDNDMEYYVEKKYRYNNKEIVLHIDNYDRYNINREYYIDVMSKDDSQLEEINKLLLNGNGHIDDNIDSNGNKSLIVSKNNS